MALVQSPAFGYHLHVSKGKDAILLAADSKLLPHDLADRLADAAGMRNVIVHMYESIDYTILADSVNPALDDFTDFIAVLAPLAEHDRDE